jgi:hypothetical protein
MVWTRNQNAELLNWILYLILSPYWNIKYFGLTSKIDLVKFILCITILTKKQ